MMVLINSPIDYQICHFEPFLVMWLTCQKWSNFNSPYGSGCWGPILLGIDLSLPPRSQGRSSSPPTGNCSWFLKEDAVSVAVCVWKKLFQSHMVFCYEMLKELVRCSYIRIVQFGDVLGGWPLGLLRTRGLVTMSMLWGCTATESLWAGSLRILYRNTKRLMLRRSCSVSRSRVFSMWVTEAFLVSLDFIHRADFRWTASRLLEYGSQITLAYSILDRTMLMYASFFSSSGQPRRS